MPIKGQSAKEVVHTELHKFKHGALHSGSKHGPLVKNRKQAIAIALSEARQVAKKADGGGDLGDQGEDEVAAPKADRLPVSTVDWSRFNQPTGSITPTTPTPTEWVGNLARNTMVGMGASPEVARHLTEGVGNIVGVTPLGIPGSVADFIEAHQRGDIGDAAIAGLGFLPGIGPEAKALAKGFTKKGAEVAQDIHNAVLNASAWDSAAHPDPADLAKTLKSFYPKDIAASAYYLGLPENEVNNLKTYMSQGSQEAFDKHYGKLLSKGKEAPPIPPQEAPIPEGWGHVPADEEIAPVPKATGTKLENVFGDALRDKYSPDDIKWIPTNAKATLKQKFDTITHDFHGVSPNYLIETLGSTHADQAPISMMGVYGQQLQKNLKKMDTGEFLKAASIYDMTPGEWNNLLSYFPEEKLDEIKSHLGHELNSHGYFVPNPQGKALPDLIDEHLNKIEWKNYKPRQQQPSDILAATKAYADKIRAAGGNPDVPLVKGGAEQFAGTYPHELLDPKKEKMYSSEQALFLADQPKVAKAYGALGAPYVAKPHHPVYEVDYHQLSKQLGSQYLYKDPVHGEVAHYGNGLLPQIMKHVQKKYDPEMLIVHNIHDWVEGGGKAPHTQYAVFKPEILRAPHAAFDPSKFHLRYPLAGIAGLGAGAGIYTYGNEPAQAAEHKRRGGPVKKKHEQIDENPQDHEFINFSKGGLIDSHIPGRTDKIPMRVRPGSYVLPADIPSALGEGNSKAGAEILKKMFTHSAYGLPPPHIHSHEFHYPHSLHFSHHKARGGKVEAEKVLPADHQLGMKVPKGGSMCANCRYLSSSNTCGNKGFVKWNGSAKLPEPANEYCCDLYESKVQAKADGGATDHVPIIAAGGEFIIHPDVVKAVGHGDMKKGHKVLDKFVLNTRKQHIDTLKKLKPPK